MAGDVFKGQELYTQYCQACHGMDGRGMMPGTRDFTRGDGLLRNDTQIHESIRTGKNGMPSFRGILTDREILDIISHLRTYQR
jgi:mono/diheme cytochrome c family protein